MLYGAFITIFLIILSFAPSTAVYCDEGSNGIPVGTVITPNNWTRYQDFMPDGMQALFAGRYFWKFPADFQMTIGPTHHYPLPKVYLDNTQKYSSSVRIVDLPNGGHSISGYQAGMPFPHPAGPLKGWQYLVDVWYGFTPYVDCNTDSWVYLKDRFGNNTTERLVQVYRMLSYVSATGQPIFNPQSKGIFYAEFTQVEVPEQSKYLTNLTLHYADPAEPEGTFIFIPALRRTLRLSTAARCAPFVGTDDTQDDVSGGGFNGGITQFDADYLGERKNLVLTVVRDNYGNPANYYPSVFFPKPSLGEWEVRDGFLLDVRRIPALRAGYCYGKRLMYVDGESYHPVWQDLYDVKGSPWKFTTFEQIAGPVPPDGIALYDTQFIAITWDIQANHLTAFISAGPSGKHMKAGDDCKNYDGLDFTDVAKYSSIEALNGILR